MSLNRLLSSLYQLRRTVMDLTVFLFYASVIVVAGIVALLIGGAIAALLGFKLNEPEYYESKKTKEKL